MLFVVALLLPIYTGPFYGTAILGVLCLLTVLEYLRIQQLEGFNLVAATVLAMLMYFGLSYLSYQKGIVTPIKYAIVLCLLFCILLISRLIRSRDPFNFQFQVLPATLYIAAPLALLLAISQWDGTYRPGVLLAILSFVWINDIMAYLVGRSIGRRPFAPKISPKKTWEGTLAGWISCIVAALVIAQFLDRFSSIQWLILGVTIAVTGTYGDLVESLFKRKRSIKDSGVFLPGHGGLLDRLDALLFSVPFAALLFLIWSL